MRLLYRRELCPCRAISLSFCLPTAKGGFLPGDGVGDVVTWCIGHLLEQAEPDAL